MSNHDMQPHCHPESFADLDYQDIIAHYNDTAGKHTHFVSKSTTSEDDMNDRKGELQYDFRFSDNFDRRDARFKSPRGRLNRDSTFTVASARTLCSLSPEPSPPASPSSYPPSSISKEAPRAEHEIGSRSVSTPMLVEKHHNFYCRLKSFLVQFFCLHPDTSIIRTCSHKFRDGQCNKCDLPEAMLPYLNGGMRAGFHCKQDGCEGCSNRILTSALGTYGSEEDCEQPLRIRSSMVASSVYANSRDKDAVSRSTVADEVPQISPMDFISTAQRVHTMTSIDSTSESRISSNNESSDLFFESNPGSYDTTVPFSSSTDYSLSVPPYLPAHDRNTSPPCLGPIITTNHKDSTPSSRSTDSSEVLEVDGLAIAVPIVQVSPTPIWIRQPGTAIQPLGIPREVQSLQDIAYDAVHGDKESQIMILKMYQDMSTADAMSASYHGSESDCHLIRKARLVLGLQVQEAAGHMPPGLVEVVSVQLLSRDRNRVMRREAFAAYICQAVAENELSEARGTQVLSLAADDR